MNSNKMKLFGLVLLLILMVPSGSHAYQTTKQSAVRINETTALYTVTYRFGFLNRELRMPIGAVRQATATTTPYVGYTFLSSDDTLVSLGASTAIVLADVVVDGTDYYLPKGKSAEFTLVSLLTIPADMTDEDLDVSLHITHLPFTMVTDGVASTVRLNPTELGSYRTPEITFSKNSETISGATHTLISK